MKISIKITLLCLSAMVLARNHGSYDDENGYYDSYDESQSDSGYSSSSSLPASSSYSSKFTSPSPSSSSSALKQDYSSSSEVEVISKRVPVAKRRAARDLTEDIVTVPRKSVHGDSTFLRKLTGFRRNLFEDGDRLEKIFDAVLQTGLEPHITTTPIAKWLPIEVQIIA